MNNVSSLSTLTMATGWLTSSRDTDSTSWYLAVLEFLSREVACCLAAAGSICAAAVLHSSQEGSQEERQAPQAALGCFSQAGRPPAGVEPALCCRRPPHSPEPKPRSSQDARSSQEGDRDGRQGVGAGKSQSLVTYRCIFVMEFCDTGVCAAPVRRTLCMVGY